MELSGASNDVLSRLLNDALHHGVGLGESLQSLHQLGEISRVLWLHSDSDDGGDGELHHLHVVSFLEGGEGSGLHQELVNTDQSADVTSGDILDGLDTSSHHEDGSLDGFLEEILLLARDVVGSHDSALLSSGDLASKHTTEGVESALVRGGHHLTDVHHQRSVGVAGLDGGTGQIVRGSLVQQLGPVLLGSDGRGQVDDDHLEHGLASGQPVPHHALHQRFSLQLLLLVLQDIVHQPAVGGGQLLHHLVSVDSELGGVHLSKLLQGEGPAVEARSKTNRGVVDINPHDSHGAIVISVGGHDDVDVLHNPGESLEEFFLLQLELEESAVHLVHEEDGSDPLSNGLPEDSLCLDTDSGHAVHHHQGTVSHTER